MMDKKSYMRLQNCKLCVRYSWSRSIVAAMSNKPSRHPSVSISAIRFKVKHLYLVRPVMLCIILLRLVLNAIYSEIFRAIPVSESPAQTSPLERFAITGVNQMNGDLQDDSQEVFQFHSSRYAGSLKISSGWF